MPTVPPYRAKRKATRALFSMPVVLVLAVLTFLSIRGTAESYRIHTEQSDKYAGAQEDLASMKAREEALRTENERLKTARGQEELFREQYMVARAGENVMVITTDKKDPNGEQSVTTEIKDTSLLSRTKKVFVGN
jgi:cell division protein FtsB